MPTLTVLANAAARSLGIIDSGGGLSAAQLADALIAANEILDNWSLDGKMALYEVITSFATVANTQGYTIGPSMTINMATPRRIQGATATLTAGSHAPIKVLQAASEWNSIDDRNAISFTPKFLFFDRGFPTGNVYLSPIPRGCANIEIATWVALTQFANVGTSITLLPGYELPLRLSLAQKLAGEYDMPFSADNKEALAMALASLIELNIQHIGPTAGKVHPMNEAPPMGVPAA